MDNYDTYRYAEADVEVLKLVNDHNKKTEEARNERQARKKARQLRSVLSRLLVTAVFGMLLALSAKGYSGALVTVLCSLGTMVSGGLLVQAMWRWAR
ncbi:MAG: hypothetical protein LUH09_06620 [Clostridiales bacterium]|nr:hypothetical protein [Clostridiales bacterium]